MRPAGMWVTALAIGAVAFGVQTGTADANRPERAKSLPPSVHLKAVEGTYCDTQEKARNDVLVKARAAVIEALRAQQPPVDWQPSVDYVREHLVTRLVESKFHPDEALLDETMWIGRAEITLTPEEQRAILKMDREHTARGRVWLAGSWAAALALALGAVAGYVRAEQATQGYLTVWLRFGLLVAFAAAGALVWLAA
jgi:hypothetical protein